MRTPLLAEIMGLVHAIAPSEMAWLDYDLRALKGTALREAEKADVILLVNGYMFWQARLFPEFVGRAPVSYSALLSTLVDEERFPALGRALEARIFDNRSDREPDFAFGLERALDGIERIVNERARG